MRLRVSESKEILFDLGHPAHVHVFRNVIRLLQRHGVSVHVTARPKEVTLQLLDAYRIPYEVVGGHYAPVGRKAFHTFARVRSIARLIRNKRVAVAMGVHNPYVALAGALASARTAVLIDSEPVRYDRLLTYPFATYLMTPRGFRNSLGRKQVRFDGFKELAYLHPNHYTPDPRIRDSLELDSSEPFFVVRFVAWSAEHDIGQSGFTLSQKRRLVTLLRNHGRLFISSESRLPLEFAPYKLSLPPERIHDVLAEANLVISESQTMTTEAAILGTPVVQTNSLVGTMSNFAELQERYGLVFAERDPNRALELAEQLAGDSELKRRARLGRDRLLQDKIDVALYLAGVAMQLLHGKTLDVPSVPERRDIAPV